MAVLIEITMAYSYNLVSGTSGFHSYLDGGSIRSSGDGQSVFIINNDSSLGTLGGVYRSTDAGATFPNKVTSATLYGNSTSTLQCLSVSDDGQQIIVGGKDSAPAKSRLFKSTDGGLNFTAITGANTLNVDEFKTISSSSNGQNLVVCYSDSSTLYLSYSTNFGVTWSSSTISAISGQSLRLCSSSTGQYVYFLSTNTVFVAFSNNYGATFSYLSASSFPTVPYGIACNDNGSKIVVADDTSGIYRSSNYGVTWTASSIIESSGRTYQDVSCDLTGNFLITYDGGATELVYTSVNAGVTWSAESLTGVTNASVFMSPTHMYSIVAKYGTGIYTGVYNLVCFKEDTKILCKVNDIEQYVPVQNLRKGDLVKTLSSGYKCIEMVGWKEMNHIVNSERIPEQLYVCCKEKFPEATEDLVLTGAHSILVEKFVNTQEDQVNKYMKEVYITENRYRLPAFIDERTRVYEKEGLCNIYHFALENDDYYMNYGVYANGVLVESSSQRYLKELSGMTLIE